MGNDCLCIPKKITLINHYRGSSSCYHYAVTEMERLLNRSGVKIEKVNKELSEVYFSLHEKFCIL